MASWRQRGLHSSCSEAGGSIGRREVMVHRHGIKATSSIPTDSRSPPALQGHTELHFSTTAFIHPDCQMTLQTYRARALSSSFYQGFQGIPLSCPTCCNPLLLTILSLITDKNERNKFRAYFPNVQVPDLCAERVLILVVM